VSTDRDLLRILAEIAQELGRFREHLARIEAVQCKLFALLERKHYPRSSDARIEVN
jgi:hypothetical protein